MGGVINNNNNIKTNKGNGITSRSNHSECSMYTLKAWCQKACATILDNFRMPMFESKKARHIVTLPPNNMLITGLLAERLEETNGGGRSGMRGFPEYTR